MAVPPGNERRFLLVATIAGMAATAIACWLLDRLSHAGVYGPLSDALFVRPYWEDVRQIAAGRLPYRDFPLEYPPASLVVFLLPLVIPGGGLVEGAYATGFEIVMAACAMGLVPVVVATVVRLGGTRRDVALAVLLLALAPLLLGSLTISRYDLWPALLTAGATLAMVSGRVRIAFALLALGTLAKVYPVFLVPVFAAAAWRTAGRRETLVGISIGAAIGLAGLVPFIVLDPGGALDPFLRAVARPLEIESVGASVLAGLHHWLGLDVGHVTFGYESYNLEGGPTSIASAVQTALLGLALAALWLASARGRLDGARLVVTSAAVIAVTVALGKVLSPQYVIWLVPPIAVLAPVRGIRPLLGAAAVLVLTQLYYPGMFQHYVQGFEPEATVAILERNAGLVVVASYLVAVTATLAARRARRRDPPSGPVPAAA